MQQQLLGGGRFAGVLNIFGGYIESGKSVLQYFVHELHEELGAVVDPADVIFVGPLLE